MTETVSILSTGSKSPPTADTMIDSGAAKNIASDKVSSRENMNNTPATPATAPPRGKGTSSTRVQANAKFDPATEDEIRDLMQNARNVDKTHQFKTEEEITKLARLTTNLIQLLNAEYIAKDTIVRAVAYMQGEGQFPPYRALTQAHRDRKAERRNTHSGQQPRNVTNGDSRARATSEGTKKAQGNSKDESTASATPQKPNVTTKAVDSPSQSSSNGESVGNGTGSEKENTSPTNANAASARPSKKNYWKIRREAKKRAASHNATKDGLRENGTKTGKAEVKDATTSQAHIDHVVGESKDTAAGKGREETTVKTD
ncbi:hypothetical protein PV08_03326 [Exophiala spinifera]|uniref:Uncharacterized protein n=1 Tax=Exophiala spinifera TaxID=91928 RepID=A0A0D1YUV7_9EURO|nr:uncharacterized protein PV08_03326 [Exophiala spinifera]KIW19036.1 hypothetical protein PV08_03326 [Exophiala spinifera]